MVRAERHAGVRVGDEEDYHFFYNPFQRAIVVTDEEALHNPFKLFFLWPWYAPLLFPNEASDARDHAANERTYLSYIRLAVYLAVVSVAFYINFHLKHAPTAFELRISHPLAFIFWALALCCLMAGFANYVRTVAKYARKAALVQSGLKTQLVFGVTSCAIVAACGVLLAADAQASNAKGGEAASVSGQSDYSEALLPPVHQAVGITNMPSAEQEFLRLLGEAAGQGLLDIGGLR